MTVKGSDIQNVVDECHLCNMNKKAPLKPISSLPIATRFNQVVAMDLHQLDNNLWYLHIICLFSRYSVAVSVRSKNAEVIAAKFLRHWIGTFGPPDESILHDNGREFSNEVLQILAEKYNFSVRTTPAYSPFCNGICERHNSTLTRTLVKIREDHPKLDLDSSLAYACFVKNSLYNNRGFTPIQIVFGENPKFPNVVDDKLPALSRKSMPEYVQEHLSALASARESYLRAENCQRIRQALRHNVRPVNQSLEFGDIVYFYANNGDWKGPAKNVGIDRQVIFVRHGGQILCVHRKNCMKKKTQSENRNFEAPNCEVEQLSNSLENEYDGDEELSEGTKRVETNLGNPEEKIHKETERQEYCID